MNDSRPRRPPRSGGFAIVAAIFLLVVLAALGAAMLAISNSQQIASALDLQGARAYQAAQAGLEWGLYQVLDPANATVVAPGTATWPHMPDCPGATTLTIEGFSVDVACTRYPGGAAGATGPPVYAESGSKRSTVVYEVTATAHAGGAVGSLGYIERVATAAVSKCRWEDSSLAPYDCP
jgi:MSHA biogenesis protein MshP